MAVTTVVQVAYQLPEGDCNKFYSSRDVADVEHDDSVDPQNPGAIIGIEHGTYDFLVVRNVNATTAGKVVVTNLGGVVEFTNALDDNTFRNNSHLEVAGDGHVGTTYGFKMNRRFFMYSVLDEDHIDYDVHHVEIDTPPNPGIGFSAIREHAGNAWTDLKFHDNYYHIDAGDPNANQQHTAFYIGNSNWNTLGYDMERCEIYDNLIVNASKGVQLGSCISGGKIYGNDVGVVRWPLATEEVGITLNPGSGHTSAVEIYGNEIVDCEGHGMYFSSNTRADIYNNKLVRVGYAPTNRDDGVKIESALNNIKVYFNDILTTLDRGIYLGNTCVGVEIYGNTILDSGGSDLLDLGAGTNYHDNQDTDNDGYTVAAYDFVDAASDDYHLLITSPAVGAGPVAGAPADDFDGVARGSPPDVGCYEYVP